MQFIFMHEKKTLITKRLEPFIHKIRRIIAITRSSVKKVCKDKHIMQITSIYVPAHSTLSSDLNDITPCVRWSIRVRHERIYLMQRYRQHPDSLTIF